MKIPFENIYRLRYYELLDEVFDSNFLSEGKFVKEFEREFKKFQGLESIAFDGWASAMDSVLSYVDIKGWDVVVPSNTFMATPLSVVKNGGNVVFADCNRNDLCLGLESLKSSITEKTKAVIIVHIGGHIAFEINEISEYCQNKGITLIEDCAHAHGASFKGNAPGSYGIGGVYSFYSTKTLTVGEGGMLVSKDEELISFAKKWRNYGKPSYDVTGSNGRMNEVTAAFGVVQMQRAPQIMKFKIDLANKYDQIFEDKVVMPEGMISGYYKYIVFKTRVSQETGYVYNEPCHKIMNHDLKLPNTAWVSKNHVCPPIWYGWEHAGSSVAEIKELLLV